jgi:hypothetical protein
MRKNFPAEVLVGDIGMKNGPSILGVVGAIGLAVALIKLAMALLKLVRGAADVWADRTLCKRLRIRHCVELGAQSDDEVLAMYEAIQHIAQALRARGCYPFYAV